MTKLLTDAAFGQNLQRLRYEKGLTQEETVAQLQILGSPIRRNTYAMIELGRGNIYVSDLVALQKIFNVDFSAFFEGIGTAR